MSLRLTVVGLLPSGSGRPDGREVVIERGPSHAAAADAVGSDMYRGRLALLLVAQQTTLYVRSSVSLLLLLLLLLLESDGVAVRRATMTTTTTTELAMYD